MPPPRTRPPKLAIQEIKLFDGYENLSMNTPAVLSKGGLGDRPCARCTESMIYFFCMFVVSVIITAIIALSFHN